MGKLTAAKPNLKELRLNKGWTQEQAAGKAKISRSYYGLIENGKKTPQVPVAKRLGKCMGFDWQDFYATELAGLLHTGDEKQ
jgi:transcriptional regulator with XRE-family HTH domain